MLRPQRGPSFQPFALAINAPAISAPACPRCRLRSLLDAHFHARERRRLSTRPLGQRQGPRALRRGFIESTRGGPPYTTSAVSGPDPPPPPPPPPSLPSSSHTPSGRTASNIRDRLRAWSVQNEIDKANKIESEFAGAGRLRGLPNALFVESTRLQTAEDEDDAELQRYQEATEGEHALNLEPGDLIYYFSHKGTVREQFAIVLGHIDYQRHLFLADGRWLVEMFWERTSIIARRFASLEEVEAIRRHAPKQVVSHPGHPSGINKDLSFTGEVPQADAAPLMHRFVDLIEQTTAFRRDNLHVLDSLHHRLAHDDKYSYMTIEKVAEKLLGRAFHALPTPAQMAVYFALRRHPTLVSIIPWGETSVAAVFLPKTHAQSFETVVNWARVYQDAAAQAALGKDVSGILNKNPLTAFIDKARRLILKSRKIRSPTTIGTLGPSSVQEYVDDHVAALPTGEIWSENDQSIIAFLWDTYIRLPRSQFRTRNHSIGSLILRAVGAYPNLRLESKIGKLLLQELGALAPWSEHQDMNVVYPLPGRFGAHEADLLYKESEDLDAELQKQDYGQLEDSMSHLRHDFGDLPVFCVDSAGTAVRDDGFSIEENHAVPGTWWIHVHIAHPSAFIDPEHVFARRARILGESLYGTTTLLPMVPFAFSKATALKDNCAALTVSTLLDGDGEVRDITLRPTTLRKVIGLEIGAVEELVGQNKPDKAYLMLEPNGTNPFPTTTKNEPSSPAALDAARPYLDVFKRVQRLMAARTKARRKAVPDYPRWHHRAVGLEARAAGVEDFQASHLLVSRHYHGDPKIKITSNRHPLEDKKGDADESMNLDLNARVMILAAESAGKWFADRGIPASFSGVLTQPGYPISRLNDEATWQSNYVLSPRSVVRSSPVPHILLVVDQYLKCTSPLRRYSDLLAHWQADAYLKAEAEGLVQPRARADNLQLPFTAAMIDDFNNNHEDIAKIGERMSKTSSRHWLFQALFRAFHFKEVELPELWDFEVGGVAHTSGFPNDSLFRGTLSPFALNAKLIASDEGWERGAERRQYLPVKIELVDADGGFVYCRAAGPPTSSFNFYQPIRLQSRSAETSRESEKISDVLES